MCAKNMFINIFFSKCPMFKVASIFLILALMLIPILIPAAPVTLALGHRLSEGTNSLNWSGYAVTASSGTVTAVYGSWIVPSVSCSKQSTYVAFWAGIDGFNSNTVSRQGYWLNAQAVKHTTRHGTSSTHLLA